MEKHGEWVVVKTLSGEYLLRRVWGAYPWAVEVTGDDEYRALSGGRRAPTPIPFPLEDVFLAEDAVVAALRAGRAIDPATLHRWAQ